MRIEISGLRKAYGAFEALKGVDFVVPSGAVLALAGPNGAGKTTLMKIIAGMLLPTEGRVRIGDLDVQANPREAHERLGFLPDFFGLYDDLTVRECLDYFARAYGLPADERADRVERAIEACRLSRKADDEIQALSRGLKQRVGIARTLINDPAVLLLDEPAAGLDPEARADLQNLFKSLGGDGGRTLIVSSHILTELEDYCTHVAMLSGGRLASFGEIDSVRAASVESRRLKALLLSGAAAAESALRSDSRVSETRTDGAWLSFRFAGDERAQADLLKSLIASGAQIARFEAEGGRIQDAYLSVMKGAAE